MSETIFLGFVGRDEGAGPEPRGAGGHRHDQRGRQQRTSILPRLL